MPVTHKFVSADTDGANTGLVRPTNWNDDHEVTDIEVTEIRLIPKASSTGAEGTIFYNSADNHIYVAME